MLLVESAQSMANRLEAVCWDDATDDLTSELKGLPYVKVKLAGIGDGTDTTNSFLEFHRLNSPYIMRGTTDDGMPFVNVLKPELFGSAPVATVKKPVKKKTEDAEPEGDKESDDIAGVVNLRRFAKVCFKYDPNSLVHGIFLEKIAGRLRHPRALSAFIEASGVGRADSGGVKFDRALPKPSIAGVDAAGGYGNVPFHRTEFTAKSITAYFSLDLRRFAATGWGTTLRTCSSHFRCGRFGSSWSRRCVYALPASWNSTHRAFHRLDPLATSSRRPTNCRRLWRSHPKMCIFFRQARRHGTDVEQPERVGVRQCRSQ